MERVTPSNIEVQITLWQHVQDSLTGVKLWLRMRSQQILRLVDAIWRLARHCWDLSLIVHPGEFIRWEFTNLRVFLLLLCCCWEPVDYFDHRFHYFNWQIWVSFSLLLQMMREFNRIIGNEADIEATYRSNLQAYAFGGLAFVRDDSQQESCMLDSWRGQMGRLQWSAVDTL